MATKTVTIDTGEWKYIDSVGVGHFVTNAQTFTMELTDTSATVVTLCPNGGTLTCTDGTKITIHKHADGSNQSRNLHTFTDAEQNTVVRNKRGEIVISSSATGTKQYWRIASIKLDDSDAPTLISSFRLEDQFGNVMNLPSTGSGWTVA
jgi:hypothetical protein